MGLVVWRRLRRDRSAGHARLLVAGDVRRVADGHRQQRRIEHRHTLDRRDRSPSSCRADEPHRDRARAKLDRPALDERHGRPDPGQRRAPPRIRLHRDSAQVATPPGAATTFTDSGLVTAHDVQVPGAHAQCGRRLAPLQHGERADDEPTGRGPARRLPRRAALVPEQRPSRPPVARKAGPSLVSITRRVGGDRPGPNTGLGRIPASTVGGH